MTNQVKILKSDLFIKYPFQ